VFSLSFPELAMIALVALLVLGPERLPGAARTAGALLRKARNSWNAVKADIERELATEEIRRSLKDVEQTGKQFASEVDSGLRQVSGEIAANAAEARKALQPEQAAAEHVVAEPASQPEALPAERTPREPAP